MKANEFVKKFGWQVAATDLRNHEKYSTRSLLYIYDDLKRIVESHELIIKDFESIEMAKYEYMVSGSHSDPYWIQVKQAIADMESCQ